MTGRGVQAAVDGLPQLNFLSVAVIIFIAQALAAPLAAPCPCAAPPSHHCAAEYLRFFAASAVLCAFLLTPVVKRHLAGPKAGARTKATPRLLLLLALGFSAASFGFGWAASFYALEIQVGLLACSASAAERATIYACHAMFGALGAWEYGNLAMNAFFSE